MSVPLPSFWLTVILLTQELHFTPTDYLHIVFVLQCFSSSGTRTFSKYLCQGSDLCTRPHSGPYTVPQMSMSASFLTCCALLYYTQFLSKWVFLPTCWFTAFLPTQDLHLSPSENLYPVLDHSTPHNSQHPNWPLRTSCLFLTYFPSSQSGNPLLFNFASLNIFWLTGFLLIQDLLSFPSEYHCPISDIWPDPLSHDPLLSM